MFLAFVIATVVANGPFLDNGATAHRGNSDEHPENTMPAFQSAIEIGADWIELDIFRTKDGKLVVTHDATTSRVGDKDLAIADSTYAELQSVDVATDFRHRHELSMAQCPKQSMPLLADVIHLIMSQQKSRLSIQPKVDCVDQAVALVKELGAEKWVGFNDGNLAYMSRVKELAPQIPVFWDRGPTDIDKDIEIARKHGFEAMVMHFATATPEKVRKVRAAGIEVGAWTVNDEKTMRRLLDIGVERIYTDTPKKLLEIQGKG